MYDLVCEIIPIHPTVHIADIPSARTLDSLSRPSRVPCLSMDD